MEIEHDKSNIYFFQSQYMFCNTKLKRWRLIDLVISENTVNNVSNFYITTHCSIIQGVGSSNGCIWELLVIYLLPKL